jgi:superfamily II RNA helicase
MATAHPTLLARLDELPQGPDGEPDRDALLEAFLEYTAELGLELYPAQEEAILELLSRRHVILTTPTGSGKSLVALFLHFQAMAEGRVSFYTAPTKALVNEKFFALCEALGPENVGLMTGDGSVNAEAPVICCTAEILSNLALRNDDLAVDYAVLDEFHFYGDRERGAAWQIPLITLKDTAFLLMSATLGEVDDIAGRLETHTLRKVAVVRGDVRPVPLVFEYREALLHETVEALVAEGAAPIYLVSFTQREAAEVAQALMSLEVCGKEDKAALDRELEGATFDTPYGKEVRRLLKHGLGVHHAGLLPRYRLLTERLAQTGLVKVISGTDTLGVGVNIPIRTVLLRQLYKYDGLKNVRLKARDFHQITGRAGRKGFDDRGRVVVLAPEWVVENRRIDLKVAAQPHLKKKLQKKRPPPGALPWDEGMCRKLQASLPEPLAPQFEVTHGMLLNLLQGAAEVEGGNGYARLIELLGRLHASERERQAQRKRAAQLFRALVKADIVRLEPRAAGGLEPKVRADLQLDFALHQPLSVYLVEALSHLERGGETWPLDALSLVEAVLEDPRVILLRQVDRLKGELVARLKAEGVEYAERMARLDELSHPKPLEEFIGATFEAFSAYHPWVGREAIRPKSIAREMAERCMTFNEYVREYGLERSEGLLLRHLSQAYKTAVQSVPEALWDEAFEDVLAYLFQAVKRTDSSLLEEWELLVKGPVDKPRPEQAQARPAPARDLTADPRAFAARVRNELHLLQKALSTRDWEAAATLVRQTERHAWSPDRFRDALAPLFAEHAGLDVTPRARKPSLTSLHQEKPGLWVVEHALRPLPRRKTRIELEAEAATPEAALAEAEELARWRLVAIIDRSLPRQDDGPLLELESLGP